jgi:hypothetical protein
MRKRYIVKGTYEFPGNEGGELLWGQIGSG